MKVQVHFIEFKLPDGLSIRQLHQEQVETEVLRNICQSCQEPKVAEDYETAISKKLVHEFMANRSSDRFKLITVRI